MVGAAEQLDRPVGRQRNAVLVARALRLDRGGDVVQTGIGGAGPDVYKRQLQERFGARPGTVWLLRPDGYVLGRWATADERVLRAALAPYYPMICLLYTSRCV